MVEKKAFIKLLNEAQVCFSDVGLESVTTDGNIQIRSYVKKDAAKHGLEV